MKYRKAVFVVVYSRVKNKIEYLILKRKLHWTGWEFPKGGRKFLESKKRAVRREVKEETGLEILKIKKFNIEGKYRYDKKYSERKSFNGQTYSLYATEVKKGKVKLDKIEHSGYKWLNFGDAIKKLRWANQKKCLRIIGRWLEENERAKI